MFMIILKLSKYYETSLTEIKKALTDSYSKTSEIQIAMSHTE